MILRGAIVGMTCKPSLFGKTVRLTVVLMPDESGGYSLAKIEGAMNLPASISFVLDEPEQEELPGFEKAPSAERKVDQETGEVTYLVRRGGRAAVVDPAEGG
jgi:hypothetical protein